MWWGNFQMHGVIYALRCVVLVVGADYIRLLLLLLLLLVVVVLLLLLYNRRRYGRNVVVVQ